jgi:hypothetical protein
MGLDDLNIATLRATGFYAQPISKNHRGRILRGSTRCSQSNRHFQQSRTSRHEGRCVEGCQGMSWNLDYLRSFSFASSLRKQRSDFSANKRLAVTYPSPHASLSTQTRIRTAKLRREDRK